MKNKELMERLNSAINKIRPYLNADGGDVEVIDITKDMVVNIRLTGACDGCPFSYMTLKSGIEEAIRKEIPEIKKVVTVNSQD
jgi:Fe-S cluster biogenesis protein NfuA